MAIPQWVVPIVAAGGIAFLAWWSRNKSNIPAKAPLPKSFDEATGMLTNWQHAPATPLKPWVPWPEAPRAATFELPQKLAPKIVARLQDEWTRAGLYLLFIREPNPLLDRPAIVALFDTTDPFVILRHVAPGEDVVAAELVTYLRVLQQTMPFRLVSASGKHATIAFLTKPSQAQPIARRMLELCPDLAQDDSMDADELAREIERTGTATFYWD